ncbi:MAG: hypothetical protein QM739_18605 [Propionivibrio sp.]
MSVDQTFNQAEQLAAHQVGVVGEAVGDVAVDPAAALLQVLRQIPVVQRDESLYSHFAQAAEQALVEVDAFPVGLPFLVHHARPGDRQAVGVEADFLHEIEVLGPAVVMVAGNRAGIAVGDLARRCAEAVPDRRQAAVLVDGAFDLKRRGRCTEDEIALPHGRVARWGEQGEFGIKQVC